MLAFGGLLIVIATGALHGEERKPDGLPSLTRDRADQAPIATFDEPEPSKAEERAYRLEKGRHYNDLNMVAEQINVEIHPKSNHWSGDMPALPTEQSDALVLGDVVSAKAYLSNDKTGIYSEFTIRVTETLKNDSREVINNGDTIIADRVGGGVRFPSGRVQQIQVLFGQRMPQVGGRYLLFLKAEEGHMLSVLTGYEFREGDVYALDSIDKFTANNGTDEITFLSTIRNRLGLKTAR